MIHLINRFRPATHFGVAAALLLARVLPARASETGFADANPYDGIDANKVDLWTYDNYHGSMYGH